MNYGKLVWSKCSPYSHKKGWYTWSHDDEVVYNAEPRKECAGWEVWASERRGVSRYLGSRPTLREVKRLADAHHHQRIERTGPPEMIEYVRRYPIGAQ